MSDLVRRIAGGEGLNLDFKFRISDQAKIARTLCAFANSEGGSLLIGVKDNGKIVGCDPEEEFYMIEGAADLKCDPPVPIRSVIHREGHHLVLEVIVEHAEKRSKAKDEDGRWTYYYRIFDKTVHSNKLLEQLWKLKQDRPVKPERFSDEVISVIRFIHSNGPVSMSRINKESGMGFAKVGNLLASLIHWDVVAFSVEDEGLRFYCPD